MAGAAHRIPPRDRRLPRRRAGNRACEALPHWSSSMRPTPPNWRTSVRPYSSSRWPRPESTTRSIVGIAPTRPAGAPILDRALDGVDAVWSPSPTIPPGRSTTSRRRCTGWRPRARCGGGLSVDHRPGRVRRRLARRASLIGRAARRRSCSGSLPTASSRRREHAVARRATWRRLTDRDRAVRAGSRLRSSGPRSRRRRPPSAARPARRRRAPCTGQSPARAGRRPNPGCRR